MRLNRVSLLNFKNIAEASLSFSPKINGFIGNNGMGKSNLLDALYFLSYCKSFTGVSDSMVIADSAETAMVKGEYTRRDTAEELSLGLMRSRRKSLKRGGKEYQRLSEHIGLFPAVLLAPGDSALVRGAPEERRRWMDMVISQGDRRYLESLIRYNAALEQRNRMLRDGCGDPSLFAAVEAQMELPAQYIHSSRTQWIERLQPLLDHFLRAIGGGEAAAVSLSLDSSLGCEYSTLGDLLERNRERDRALRHTTSGPHRDDIAMTLHSMPMRRTASEGQCKTFTTALRLAQYSFLRDSIGMEPLLLLDDIFDKLDATRVERIVSLVTGEGFGQIFITDTNRAHLDEIMARTGGDYRLWSVDSGNFTPLH